MILVGLNSVNLNMLKIDLEYKIIIDIIHF